jgi:hypothetical protein
VEATVFDHESRAKSLCAAPAGCAFLLIAEESGLAPEVIAEMDVAVEMAAVAVNEVRPWFPAHDRVVAMALEHGPRLLDLAHQILRQPAAERWFAPLERNRQEWVDFDGGSESIPVPERPERPTTGWECYAQKPEWGFWTSTAIDDHGKSSFLTGVMNGTGDLSDFRRDRSLPFARYRIIISPAGRVYEVDGPESWHRLCTTFPDTGEDGRLVPDWVAVANEWDGVHLTLGGLLTSEQVRIERPEGWTEHWAWDVERTVWLRAVFDGFERLPDLSALPDVQEAISWPRALWIEPGPDTHPWLVGIFARVPDPESERDDGEPEL